jgi:hypothetical protein
MNLIRTLFVMLVFIGLSSCAVSVKVDYDEKIDFDALKSFNILVPDKSKTEDIRISSPLFATRVSNALVTTLNSRGYIKNEKNPDFYVTYHLRIKQEVESRSTGMHVGAGSYGHHSAIGMSYGFPAYDVYSYDRGILTIDVLNSKKVLIWRGSTSRILNDEKTPQESDKIINEVVTQILDVFPPVKKVAEK